MGIFLNISWKDEITKGLTVGIVCGGGMEQKEESPLVYNETKEIVKTGWRWIELSQLYLFFFFFLVFQFLADYDWFC